MAKDSIWSPLLCIFLGLAIVSAEAAAPSTLYGDTDSTPRIGRIAVSADLKHLYVDVTLENGLTPQVVETLQSGLSVIFVYEISLESPRIIKGKELTSKKIERVLSYDSLKNEYLVAYGPAKPVYITLKDLDKAGEEVFHIRTRLLSLARLRPGQVYKVRVRAWAEKEQQSLLPFGGMVKMFTRWGYKTKWKEITFSY